MPIFISHTPEDKRFADNLVIQLARHNVNVWIDLWQLADGDSLSKKIIEEVHGTSALLVILSKESTATEWCKSDLSAEKLRELDGRNVVVMPVMVENCDIPEFARDKLFADFRTDCDDGLCTIIEGVDKVTNPTQARVIQLNYNQDWAIEWGIVNDRLTAIFTFVLMHQTLSFSCIITIQMQGNPVATRMYTENKEKNGVGAAKLHVAETLHAHFAAMPNVIPMFSEDDGKTFQLPINGSSSDEVYFATINIRTVGDDPGRDIPVDLKGLVERTYKHMSDVLRRPSRSGSNL